VVSAAAAAAILNCPQGTHDGLLEMCFFTCIQVAVKEKTCPKHVTLRGGCAAIRDTVKNRDLFLFPVITVT
jgi:hypothetical protein